MARAKHPPTPYTEIERDYIFRVAGKVPPVVIAAQINREVSSVLQWAHRNGIKLSVPRHIMLKHWREYDAWSKKADQKTLQK